ncbi:MAG: arginase [Bacteroidetes bacterium]|nr:arginase [Bacteroidota bacterium]
MNDDSLSDLLHYFDPVEVLQPAISPIGLAKNLGDKTQINTGGRGISLKDASIIIIGAPGDPIADRIRRHLYALGPIDELEGIVDLGNFRQGKTARDTHKGWEDVITELGRKQKIILILGGSTEQIGNQINAFTRLEHPINLMLISPDFHLAAKPKEADATYLNRVLLQDDNFLFDFTHLAYQSYYTDPATLELLDKLYFSYMRLGEIRQDIRETEPYFRNTDMLAFSMSAIRASDSPGSRLHSANGLYAEEGCQLARYAGLSDKLMCFSLLDTDSDLGSNEITPNLGAQLIWHFLQGVSQRKSDYPFAPIKSYQKYIVNLPRAGHDINFYRSPKTDRWWLEVPYPNPKYPRSVYVACTVRDYQLASNGEIPDRWLKTYQRIC